MHFQSVVLLLCRTAQYGVRPESKAGLNGTGGRQRIPQCHLGQNSKTEKLNRLQGGQSCWRSTHGAQLEASHVFRQPGARLLQWIRSTTNFLRQAGQEIAITGHLSVEFSGNGAEGTVSSRVTEMRENLQSGAGAGEVIVEVGVEVVT